MGEYVSHIQNTRIAELESLAFLLYRTLSDEPIDSLVWLPPEKRRLLTDVVEELSPHLDPERAQTEMQKLRTVIEDAIGMIERSQFAGHVCDTCTETYRVLCDEGIAPEPEEHAGG